MLAHESLPMSSGWVAHFHVHHHVYDQFPLKCKRQNTYMCIVYQEQHPTSYLTPNCCFITILLHWSTSYVRDIFFETCSIGTMSTVSRHILYFKCCCAWYLDIYVVLHIESTNKVSWRWCFVSIMCSLFLAPSKITLFYRGLFSENVRCNAILTASQFWGPGEPAECRVSFSCVWPQAGETGNVIWETDGLYLLVLYGMY